MKTLGLDIGSSSVKAAVMDTITGECVASFTSPGTELPIDAPHPGWAEQAPKLWWEHVSICMREIFSSGKVRADEIAAIGIT